ncbi:hypothetical protein BJ878DRAFT_535071 [Calycina marina]|uniref:Uncharacterized protein n=1 Tax=Calycina marina TaxID=1763456 RepID=A0A9P7Z1S5_9HELO|nr:hypothetical protein BJ878DRAFT_535071 [Calycina marina]
MCKGYLDFWMLSIRMNPQRLAFEMTTGRSSMGFNADFQFTQKISSLTLDPWVLRQPAMSEILHHIQDAAKCTQNIQRDITVIKSSVGLSATPVSAANFSGGRAAAASWSQVASQARGSPPLPPPVPHDMRASNTYSTVTAYKDRAVTVKLRDHGFSQRSRSLSATRIKHQVQTSIRDNAATKEVKIVAAHQNKSGDVQVFTSSTSEATKLKENRGWVRIIVHGIFTNSIDTKDQKATIQQILTDNYKVIPKAEISFVRWLTKESPLKRASSIVVEFIDPEMAKAIIYTGMVWDGQQFFRCYNYRHIGTQCNAVQTCGYCAELHESKNCKQKGAEGFTPRCAVCRARKKEMERVEQAKQTRNIYWHVNLKDVASKDNNTRTSNRHTSSLTANRTVRIPETPIVETSFQATTSSEPPITQERETSPESQAPPENIGTRASVDRSVAEDWATPATQREPIQQQSTIDPQILATEQSPTHGQAADGILDRETTEMMQTDIMPPRQSQYPLNGIEGQFTNDANDWLHDTVESARSPPASLATDIHFTTTAELRKHMRKETRGKGSATTPAWTSIPDAETPV